MTDKLVNVMCIKWGKRYGPHYVNRLHAMVRRNLSLPHRFVCLTDDPVDDLDPGIEVFPIPDIRIPERNRFSPWRKISMFSREIGDLSGKTLFLDLDVLVVDSIDCFFSYSDEFTIIENWTQPGRGVGNSSVYLFEIGHHADVLDNFRADPEKVTASYPNSQTYLSKRIGKLNYWPDEWVRSFKFHAIPRWPMRLFRTPRLPPGCRILVFHGYPNPDQALNGDYRGKLHKYFRPAPWIADYWHG